MILIIVSVTTKVQPYPLSLSGKNFVLVDTPGFDDGERTDEDVFESLADWLRQSYNKGQRFNGLLYLHRIIANREKGSDLRNLRVFKKLCGEENFDKVVLGITWWDQVEPEVALAREQMLRETPDFWGDMVRKGSRIERIPHDKAQCIQFVLEFAKNQRTTLRIQDEMVEGKEARETTAAKEMEQYKAIHAIKDAEKGDRKAQELTYKLKSQVIDQWASEQRMEQHRRLQERQMQQMSQIASLQTIRKQMEDVSSSRIPPNAQISAKERKIKELMEALKQAKLRTQPPRYTPLEDRLERMKMVGRSKLHYAEIQAAAERLEGLAKSPNQDWSSIRDPCKEEEAWLWQSFCDRCLRQASVKGYWACTKCTVEVTDPDEKIYTAWFLLCNQCKAKGQTCLDRTHRLTQASPGDVNPNEYIQNQIEFCPRARHISAAVRCSKCKATPGPVFLHCCQCEEDDFDLCLDCFERGKTCKKRRKHTLLLHSWCPPSEWRRIEQAATVKIE